MTATNRSVRSMVSTCLWLMVLAAALVVLWPARFGGAAVFVVVRGESMEPSYHTGDLLYARTSDSFEIGDIAVYEQPVNGSTSLVVHRLVAELDDGTLHFQGDNRTTVDAYRPTRADVVAKPIANLGPVPTHLLIRLPILLALVVAITVVWALWPRKDELPPADEEPKAPSLAKAPPPTHRDPRVMVSVRVSAATGSSH